MQYVLDSDYTLTIKGDFEKLMSLSRAICGRELDNDDVLNLEDLAEYLDGKFLADDDAPTVDLPALEQAQDKVEQALECIDANVVEKRKAKDVLENVRKILMDTPEKKVLRATLSDKARENITNSGTFLGYTRKEWGKARGLYASETDEHFLQFGGLPVEKQEDYLKRARILCEEDREDTEAEERSEYLDEFDEANKWKPREDPSYAPPADQHRKSVAFTTEELDKARELFEYENPVAWDHASDEDAMYYCMVARGICLHRPKT